MVVVVAVALAGVEQVRCWVWRRFGGGNVLEVGGSGSMRSSIGREPSRFSEIDRHTTVTAPSPQRGVIGLIANEKFSQLARSRPGAGYACTVLYLLGPNN